MVRRGDGDLGRRLDERGNVGKEKHRHEVNQYGKLSAGKSHRGMTKRGSGRGMVGGRCWNWRASGGAVRPTFFGFPTFASFASFSTFTTFKTFLLTAGHVCVSKAFAFTAFVTGVCLRNEIT